jgi:hypothetical protein
MKAKNHNGLGLIMNDEVLSDLNIRDCVETFSGDDGEITGLKINPLIEKLLLQVMKAESDTEYLQECIRKLDEETRNNIGLT